METFTKKTLKTARGFDYAYYTTPNINPSSPTLLFVHGFPDHAFMWDEVVAHVLSNPSLASYNVVVPDKLGYGGSSKPTDPAAYAFPAMADELAEILDAEGVTQQVVVVGHDWGSFLAQNFFWFHRARVVGLAMVSVAYMPPDPTGKRDMAASAALFERTFGYSQFAYWDLLTAPDAPALMRANLERVYVALHGDRPDWMRDIFCTPGAFRAFVEGTHPESGKVALKPFAQTEKRRRQFIDRFRSDGFDAPVQYYVAGKIGTLAENARRVGPEALRADLPVLFVGSTGDAVCRPELIEGSAKAGLLPDLEKHVIQDCGHWIPMERPTELGGYLAAWLEKKFAAADKA
ncbi:hypothetical protein MCOR02_009387 [Pyricularia oryzae]|uniref:AB hydrolase-1 domain-containing protein n=2 Tax=Pyricularia TaxID=48558 RepID=A0ABQ8N7W4_PYRGI|nr:hypothetical protein MCOR01_001779 [Pyricularia oryzae]KAI6292359.1 hypothetical protein MCOR33_009926 [Pyricularia grisea]KAH9429650.1 hypothetical protein MCOR02_009387 [Pyricularia oryzae]KAI6269063.1 hypothetical protein MCOR26_008900 [Pyricularia oryzae]KAI6296932.1 hypothetical protein MCOR34_009425 [Pyricularia oryzae]